MEKDTGFFSPRVVLSIRVSSVPSHQNPRWPAPAMAMRSSKRWGGLRWLHLAGARLPAGCGTSGTPALSSRVDTAKGR